LEFDDQKLDYHNLQNWASVHPEHVFTVKIWHAAAGEFLAGDPVTQPITCAQCTHKHRSNRQMHPPKQQQARVSDTQTSQNATCRSRRPRLASGAALSLTVRRRSARATHTRGKPRTPRSALTVQFVHAIVLSINVRFARTTPASTRTRLLTPNLRAHTSQPAIQYLGIAPGSHPNTKHDVSPQEVEYAGPAG
jgi:hypothetical protein